MVVRTCGKEQAICDSKNEPDSKALGFLCFRLDWGCIHIVRFTAITSLNENDFLFEIWQHILCY